MFHTVQEEEQPPPSPTGGVFGGRARLTHPLGCSVGNQMVGSAAGSAVAAVELHSDGADLQTCDADAGAHGGATRQSIPGGGCVCSCSLAK